MYPTTAEGADDLKLFSRPIWIWFQEGKYLDDWRVRIAIPKKLVQVPIGEVKIVEVWNRF